jgi:hypothetical protein
VEWLDMNGVLQVEMRSQRRKVVCVVIHIVTSARLSGSPWLRRSAWLDAIALLEKEQHLRVPVIGRQRQPWLKTMG